MANFYGTLRGARETIATKTGTKNSGIRASVQSWKGSIITELREEDEKTIAFVYVAKGSDNYGDLLFKGTIEELKNKLGE